MCNNPLELIFVLDGSGSIEILGKGNFKLCLNFIVQVEKSFMISPRKTRVAVVLFSHRATTVFSLDTYRDVNSVTAATKRIQYPKGGTKIGSALRLVQSDIMRKARKAVAKVNDRASYSIEGNFGYRLKRSISDTSGQRGGISPARARSVPIKTQDVLCVLCYVIVIQLTPFWGFSVADYIKYITLTFNLN